MSSAFAKWAGRLRERQPCSDPDCKICPEERELASLLEAAEGLRVALVRIEAIEARADGSEGFVDFPHVKAVRAMATIARAALAAADAAGKERV